MSLKINFFGGCKKICDFIESCMKPTCSVCGCTELTLCDIEYDHMRQNPDCVICDKSKKHYQCTECGADILIL